MSKVFSNLGREGKWKWDEYFEYYFPGISKGILDYILWNETCYPCDTRLVLRQIRRAIRAHKNNIKVCPCCGMKMEFCIRRIAR